MIMHLSTSFVLIAVISQSLTAASLPVETRESLTSLTTRELEETATKFLTAREFLASGWDEPEALSARDLEDLEFTLRSLSNEELLALDVRGLKGLGKLARVAASPIKKLASAIRPGSRKAAVTAPKKSKKSGSRSKGSSAKSTPSKVSQSGSSNRVVAKKSGGKSSKSSGTKKGSSSKGGKASAPAAVSGKKGAKSKKKASGSSKGGSKKGGGKKASAKGKDASSKGKKSGSGKKGSKPTRTRNRTLNVNVDPGTLLNAGAAIANLVGMGGN